MVFECGDMARVFLNFQLQVALSLYYIVPHINVYIICKKILSCMHYAECHTDIIHLWTKKILCWLIYTVL